MQEYISRILMKNDSEANWITAGNNGFVPLQGELIIYNSDGTHSYARLKIGDGSTNVNSLLFIDSGTIGGNEVEIVKAEDRNHFPENGSEDKLYVALDTNRIFHYNTTTNTYVQLSNFSYRVTTTEVTKVTSWTPGIITEVSVENNVLKIKNGTLPELLYYTTQAASGIVKE